MNRDRRDDVLLLIVWHHDELRPVPPNYYPAPRHCIKVALARKAEELLDEGKIKAAGACPIAQIIELFRNKR
jgi:hypothetical protein